MKDCNFLVNHYINVWFEINFIKKYVFLDSFYINHKQLKIIYYE